ncbi:MAG: NADH-quinone oxidoreductase subunit NuoK [Verrucomicrobiae bacterium]|nr:NADH-quinone oxidoreductase subunit NuoK [Verrucomicrobiae bacterium]
MPLGYYLVLGAVLFGIGLCGALTRRNAIAVLMSIEIMFNAAILNFVVFWYYLHNGALTGQVVALFAIAVAAAESAVGLALVIAVYRHYRSVNVDQMRALRG